MSDTGFFVVLLGYTLTGILVVWLLDRSGRIIIYDHHVVALCCWPVLLAVQCVRWIRR